MRKFLTFILISFSCFSAQSQISLPFREEANISVDLYWSKGFDLISDSRFGMAEELIDDLLASSVGKCDVFDQDFALFKAALVTQDKSLAENAFTELILNSLLLEINRLDSIESVSLRKKSVVNLFKELISIQKYIKAYDFATYKTLVICFRRLNQLSGDQEKLKSYIKSFELMSKLKESC